MKIRGDVSSVNLSTGEKKEFLVGDGEVRQVPAALHKEGAGGEPKCTACGHARDLHSMEMPYDCQSDCDCRGFSYVPVQPDHSKCGPACGVLQCKCSCHIGPSESLALPLQRTLPDEQFKGAVVEAIGTEGAQMELSGDDVAACVRIFGLESVSLDQWRALQEWVNGLASPADRAEQEPK